MKKIETTIGQVSALILGESSDKVYLFIHGNSGSKQEAVPFAEIAVPKGYQVIGIDLPVMGKPWHVLELIEDVKQYLKENYSSINLRANSIGSYYSLMAFQREKIDNALFVSPILDMKTYIEVKDVKGHNVRNGDYYKFVSENPIYSLKAVTHFLMPKVDLIVDERVYEYFLSSHDGSITVMEDGEHWFHTDKQLDFLKKWEEEHI
ncbi:MAG: alpha/beta hydrolase [Bacteroidales bacterium]|nr:alpha/beta hydrolase [Bacteroidales bacterium]